MPGNHADTLVLEPGSHSLKLLGVAEHCSVEPGFSVEEEVISARTTTVRFEISCPLTELEVSVTTGGEFLDGNGYVLIVDGFPRGAIHATGSMLLTRLAPGPHTVSLGDLAANCTADDVPREVTVAANRVVEVELRVTCVALPTTIRVVARTSGQAPESFEVLLWHSEGPSDYYDTWISLGGVPANGVLSVNVDPGVYWVELTGLYTWAYYCGATVPNPTAPFTLARGSVVELEFPVTCSP
jgi:hypothetical protein